MNLETSLNQNGYRKVTLIPMIEEYYQNLDKNKFCISDDFELICAHSGAPIFQNDVIQGLQFGNLCQEFQTRYDLEEHQPWKDEIQFHTDLEKPFYEIAKEPFTLKVFDVNDNQSVLRTKWIISNVSLTQLVIQSANQWNDCVKLARWQNNGRSFLITSPTAKPTRISPVFVGNHRYGQFQCYLTAHIGLPFSKLSNNHLMNFNDVLTWKTISRYSPYLIFGAQIYFDSISPDFFFELQTTLNGRYHSLFQSVKKPFDGGDTGSYWTEEKSPHSGEIAVRKLIENECTNYHLSLNTNRHRNNANIYSIFNQAPTFHELDIQFAIRSNTEILDLLPLQKPRFKLLPPQSITTSFISCPNCSPLGVKGHFPTTSCSVRLNDEQEIVDHFMAKSQKGAVSVGKYSAIYSVQNFEKFHKHLNNKFHSNIISQDSYVQEFNSFFKVNFGSLQTFNMSWTGKDVMVELKNVNDLDFAQFLQTSAISRLTEEHLPFLMNEEEKKSSSCDEQSLPINSEMPFTLEFGVFSDPSFKLTTPIPSNTPSPSEQEMIGSLIGFQELHYSENDELDLEQSSEDDELESTNDEDYEDFDLFYPRNPPRIQLNQFPSNYSAHPTTTKTSIENDLNDVNSSHSQIQQISNSEMDEDEDSDIFNDN